MNKYFLLLVCCLLSLTCANAKVRSEAEMQAIALQKLKMASGAKSKSGAKASQLVCLKETKNYNIYGLKDRPGFAIVAKDNVFNGLLAYSNSTFDESTMPDGYAWWISAVNKVMSKYASGEITLPGNYKAATANYSVVEPFITTQWGQGTPYNNRVPLINGEHAPAGCVAVAMAQVMNYARYPASAQFRGYYFVNQQPDSMDINDTYRWPYKNTYTTTDMQGSRVATLIRDCGYAVYMQYTSSGSGASSYMAPYALVHTFGYPEEAVKYMGRDYYTADEWSSRIYDELSKGYPVIYAGFDASSGGHEFIFHGVDADGLVYVNWGWDGASDGYFDFNILNVGGYRFDLGQDMAVGLRRTALSSDEVEPQFVTDTVYSFKYDNDIDSMTICFNQPVFNMSVADFTGRLCLAFQDTDGGDVQYEDLIEPGDTIWAGYGFDAQEFGGDVKEDISLEPGHTYTIYITAQMIDQAEWFPLRTIGGPITYTLTVADDGRITIGDNPSTTAIKTIGFQRGSDTDHHWYTVDGKKTASPSRPGIYIRNGMKVVRK